MNQDAQTATKKAAIHKRLSKLSKEKAGSLTKQFHDLRYELEVICDKANDEFYNLQLLLIVDAVKKETIENRVETLENRVFDIEHEFAEATESPVVSLLVGHLISYYVLLYLPKV